MRGSHRPQGAHLQIDTLLDLAFRLRTGWTQPTAGYHSSRHQAGEYLPDLARLFKRSHSSLDFQGSASFALRKSLAGVVANSSPKQIPWAFRLGARRAPSV
jgi:hypothetical protein